MTLLSAYLNPEEAGQASADTTKDIIIPPVTMGTQQAQHAHA